MKIRKPIELEANRSALDRRGFLIRGGSLLLILPLGWSIAGCGDNNTPAQTVQSGALVYTSSVTEGHTHQFSLDAQEVAAPPLAGITRDTTVTLSHMHTIVLSQAELDQIQANQVVTKDTTVTDGHMHTFQFSLSAAGSTGPGTTTTTTTGGGTGTGTGTGGY